MWIRDRSNWGLSVTAAERDALNRHAGPMLTTAQAVLRLGRESWDGE
jgi:hypothetical protein